MRKGARGSLRGYAIHFPYFMKIISEPENHLRFPFLDWAWRFSDARYFMISALFRCVNKLSNQPGACSRHAMSLGLQVGQPITVSPFLSWIGRRDEQQVCPLFGRWFFWHNSTRRIR